MTEKYRERNDANLLSFKDCHLNNLLSKRSIEKKQQGEVGKVTLVNTGVGHRHRMTEILCLMLEIGF